MTLSDLLVLKRTICLNQKHLFESSAELSYSSSSASLSVSNSSSIRSSVSPASSSSSFRSHHEAMEFHYLVLHVGWKALSQSRLSSRGNCMATFPFRVPEPGEILKSGSELSSFAFSRIMMLFTATPANIKTMRSAINSERPT